MKDEYGYELKYIDSDGNMAKHEYLVDGCNVEPGYKPENGMFTIEDTKSCRTMAEAMKTMRSWCKEFYKVTIYDQWLDCEDGSPVSQKITDYRNGKKIGGITM